MRYKKGYIVLPFIDALYPPSPPPTLVLIFQVVGENTEDSQDDSIVESNRSKRLSARKTDEIISNTSRSKRLSARLSRNPSDEQQEQSKNDTEKEKSTENKSDSQECDTRSYIEPKPNTSSGPMSRTVSSDSKNTEEDCAISRINSSKIHGVKESEPYDGITKPSSEITSEITSGITSEGLQSSILSSDEPSSTELSKKVLIESKADEITSSSSASTTQLSNTIASGIQDIPSLSDRTASSTPEKEALWTSMNTEHSNNESAEEQKSTVPKSSSKIDEVQEKLPLHSEKSSDSSISVDKSATHHKIIIDDVIEFEVPKKAASPAKPPVESSSTKSSVEITSTSIRSMVESGLKSAVESGAVFKPRKLELTEPEPIPITDPKSSKRNHASCSNKDNKMSVVNSSKGSRGSSKNTGGSGGESIKIPIVGGNSGDEQQRHSTPEKKGTGDRDAMSDHISQLQKNQRDQSARLVGFSEV